MLQEQIKGTSEGAGLHSWPSSQYVPHSLGHSAPLATDWSDCCCNIHEMLTLSAELQNETGRNTRWCWQCSKSEEFGRGVRNVCDKWTQIKEKQELCMENVPVFHPKFQKHEETPVVYLGRQHILEMVEGSADDGFSWRAVVEQMSICITCNRPHEKWKMMALNHLLAEIKQPVHM